MNSKFECKMNLLRGTSAIKTPYKQEKPVDNSTGFL